MSSELDFGLDTENKDSVISIDKDFFDEFDSKFMKSYEPENDEVILTDDVIVNPFFVNINGGIVQEMDNRKLYSTYNRVLILCLKNNNEFKDIDQIFEKVLEKDKFNKLINSFTLIKSTNRLLKNKLHRRNAVIVERYQLSNIEHNFELENDEIIIPMPEIEEKDLKNYTNLYFSDQDFKQLSISKLFYKYFNGNSYKYPLQKGLNRITKSIKETDYWTNFYNCGLNITKNLLDRSFHFRKRTDQNVKASIQPTKYSEAVNKVLNKLNMNTGNDYPQILYTKKIFTDASDSLKNKDFKIYRVNNNPIELNKDQVTEMFMMSSNQREQFDLFNALLISKDYCHLAINNKQVLEKMDKIITKYKPLYKYLFGYAWVCMYMEECIVKTRTLTNNRYVFDIDTANKLPFFPYSSEDIHMNPYCSLLVNSNVINSKNNCLGLPMINDYNDYGIDTLEGFTKKFNLFTTGKIDCSIFDGLETEEGSNKWKYFAVGGSVMTCCVEKRNPLFDVVNSNNVSYEEGWIRFYNEYYKNSDIDLMCNKKSVFDFLNEVEKLIVVIKNNLEKTVNPIIKKSVEQTGKNISDTITIEPTKSLNIYINSEYIEECMPDHDIDYVINNFSSNEIKERFYSEYFKLKYTRNNELRKKYKNKKLFEYYYKIVSQDDMNISLTDYKEVKNNHNIHDSNMYIYLNDIRDKDNQVQQNENIILMKICENVKFKITSEYLPHSIEVFRTQYEEFFSCVSRFHLPCVRSYYDGGNVYLLPSCITALMTHINIDYKYFAGIRDPIEIINKYRMRGFGTIINDKEKSHMVEYNISIEPWNKIFGINSSQSSIKNHLGPLTLQNSLFRPNVVIDNLPSDTYNNQNKEYFLNNKDLYSAYKNLYGYDSTKYGLDLLQFKTINKDGDINPVKKWVIDATYDLIH